MRTTLTRPLSRVFVFLAAALGLMFMLQAAPQLEAALADTPWDLNVDRLTASAYLDHYSPFSPEGAVRSGVAAYGPAGNGHPPTTAFWMLPLARMSARTAATAVAWITVILLVLELAMAMTLLRYPAPFVGAWLALGILLSSSFMRYHLAVGQISGLIGFLYFVAWAAGRTRDDWLAGAALGACCTMKVFPGVMVVFFLLARRWRAAVSAAAVYVAVAVIMTARFGVRSWPQFLAQQAPIAHQWMASIQNQSIHGIILRLFWPVCVPQGPVLRSATIISTLVSLALLGLGTRLVWRIARTDRFDISFALFVVLSIVTSQWTWEHYTVIYVVPILILGAHLVTSWRARRHRFGVAVMLAAVAGCVASWRISMSTKIDAQAAFLRGTPGTHLRLHIYDVLNWAPGLVLLAVLLVACWWETKDRRADAVAAPPLMNTVESPASDFELQART